MGEWMSVTEEISDLMLRRSPTGAIQDAAISAGMKTLFDAGVDLVRNGVTTLDELQLAVYPEDYVS
jgi:type II secretory ATPase GspE/PulE/Tfp pilus assembly ATPase PilB-like protein